MLVGRAEQGKTTLMHRLMRDYTYNINHSTNGTWKCLVLPVQLLREWRVLSVYIHIYCLQVANTTPEGGSWVIPILRPRKGWPLAYHRGLRPVLFSNSVGLAEFPQFGKKMPHKIYVASSNGAPKKIDPRIGTCIIIIFFWNEVFKTITDNNTDLTAALFLEKGPLILQKGAHLTLTGQFLELTLQCCGFFCFPQISNQISGSSVRRDQRFFRPYPRGLESLTAFVDVITKAALSSQLLKDPKCWSGRYLNPRPPAQQTDALPTELTRQLFVKFFFILWEVVGKLQKEMFHASIG